MRFYNGNRISTTAASTFTHGTCTPACSIKKGRVLLHRDLADRPRGRS